MQIASQPEVAFFPRILDNPSRLECSYGWNDDTTRAFLESDFERLVIKGGKSQAVNIPGLGKKASHIYDIDLDTLGQINGLEQFINIKNIDISSVPSNGINIGLFANLESLFCEWDEVLVDQVFNIKTIKNLAILGYPKSDCALFKSLTNLKEVGLTQGRVKSLSGIEFCKDIERLSLTYIKSLTDIQALYQLKKLKDLSLGNLPKVNGCLNLSSFRNLNSLYIVSTPLSVDLSSINKVANPHKIWLNVSHINLDWRILFGKSALKTIGLMKGKEYPYNDDELYTYAKDCGRKIKNVKHVGNKKTGQIQIELN